MTTLVDGRVKSGLFVIDCSNVRPIKAQGEAISWAWNFYNKGLKRVKHDELDLYF